VDHVTDEVHEQSEEVGVDDFVVDAFSGEPHDTSVLMDYVYHVAVTV